MGDLNSGRYINLMKQNLESKQWTELVKIGKDDLIKLKKQDYLSKVKNVDDSFLFLEDLEIAVDKEGKTPQEIKVLTEEATETAKAKIRNAAKEELAKYLKTGEAIRKISLEIQKIAEFWDKQEALCKGQILNSIHEKIRPGYSNFKTSKELWKEIHLKFNKQTHGRREMLLTKFQTLPMGKMSIDEFYTELKLIAEERKYANDVCDDEAVIYQMIKKLPPAYKDPVNAIKWSPHLDVETALTQLRKCEMELLAFGMAQFSAQTATVNETAETSLGPDGNCDLHPNAIRKHTNQKCFTQHPELKVQVKTEEKQNAAKRAARDEAAARRKFAEQNEEAFKAFKAKSGNKESSKYSASVDSAAYPHMLNNSDLFTSINPTLSSIHLADGSISPAQGQGDAKIQYKTNKLELKDSLLTPSFPQSLISVPKLDQTGHTVTFKNYNCNIRHPNNLIDINIPLDPNAGLYQMKFTVPDERQQVAFQSTSPSFTESEKRVPSDMQPTVNHSRLTKLWHERFGHLNHDYLRKVVEQQMANDIPTFKVVKPAIRCPGCMEGKSHRQPYPHSTPTEYQ